MAKELDRGVWIKSKNINLLQKNHSIGPTMHIECRQSIRLESLVVSGYYIVHVSFNGDEINNPETWVKIVKRVKDTLYKDSKTLKIYAMSMNKLRVHE
jgi:hypothetical protein